MALKRLARLLVFCTLAVVLLGGDQAKQGGDQWKWYYNANDHYSSPYKVLFHGTKPMRAYQETPSTGYGDAGPWHEVPLSDVRKKGLVASLRERSRRP